MPVYNHGNQFSGVVQVLVSGEIGRLSSVHEFLKVAQ